MTTKLDVILVGGASHVGKTQFASALANRLGFEHVCTDDLGRHPERPWETRSDAVCELYQTVSPETLHWLLRIHHQNIWPAVEQRLAEARIGARPVVLEGNALRPELVQEQMVQGTVALCLTAPDHVLRDRIWTSSGYDAATPEERTRIRSFLGRTLLDKKAMEDAAKRDGVPLVDATDHKTLHAWAEAIVTG